MHDKCKNEDNPSAFFHWVSVVVNFLSPKIFLFLLFQLHALATLPYPKTRETKII